MLNLTKTRNNENNSNKNSIYIKLICCLFIICFSVYNSLTNFVQVEIVPRCMEDKLITKTTPIHELLKKDFLVRKWLMIGFAGLLDLCLFLCALLWIKKGRNLRPIIHLILFFAFKMFCTWIFKMRNSQDMIWEFPGFPSLVVSYKRSGNSYFSGVIGLYVIISTVLYELNQKAMSIINSIAMVGYIILMLSLRVEGFISITSALMAAHYFYFISSKYCLIFGEFSIPSSRFIKVKEEGISNIDKGFVI